MREGGVKKDTSFNHVTIGICNNYFTENGRSNGKGGIRSGSSIGYNVVCNACVVSNVFEYQKLILKNNTTQKGTENIYLNILWYNIFFL